MPLVVTNAENRCPGASNSPADICCRHGKQEDLLLPRNLLRLNPFCCVQARSFLDQNDASHVNLWPNSIQEMGSVTSSLRSEAPSPQGIEDARTSVTKTVEVLKSANFPPGETLKSDTGAGGMLIQETQKDPPIRGSAR